MGGCIAVLIKIRDAGIAPFAEVVRIATRMLVRDLRWFLRLLLDDSFNHKSNVTKAANDVAERINEWRVTSPAGRSGIILECAVAIVLKGMREAKGQHPLL